MNKTRLQKYMALTLSLVLASGLFACGKETADTVSVQQVAMLMETTLADVNRCGGIVVSQSETEIKKEESQGIADVLVTEGQAVEEGTVLFTYDMEDLNLTIDKAKLEIEQIQNSITTYGEQIAQLEKEKSAASASEQLSYTVQIQGLVLDRKEAQYNLEVKKTELAALLESAQNNAVTSPIAGHVQSINLDGGTDNNGNPLPFMTIVESGVFRVKGAINELNRNDLMEGSPVIIRSRVDDQIWRGTVEMINWDSPEQNNNASYYMEPSQDSTSFASTYPFYVTIENPDGLMLGQHVFVEPDFGQADENPYITLGEEFIVLKDDGAYVWAASSRSTLELRAVTLGAKDGELGTYEILEGLTLEDYIAFPEKDLAAGLSVTYYDAASFEGEEESDEEFVEEDFTDEEFVVEESVDEEFVEDIAHDVPVEE